MKRTHGMSLTREYRSWTAMRKRCQSPSAHNYGRYGGRGIRICERWQSFANFYADMGDCPEGGSLERIDRDGHYEPGNCKWIPLRLQSRNRNIVRAVTIDGVTKPLVEWCEQYGVPPRLAWTRMNKGWTDVRAVTTPRCEPNPTTGRRQWNARFTDDDVRAIRASSEPGVALACRYGVSKSCISGIRSGKVWSHVT